MLMIVTLHFLGKGGVLNAPLDSTRHIFGWAIESVCIVAVNCYVLISGYFLVNSKFKLSRLSQLLVHVLFYSVSIAFLLVVTGREELNVSNTITTLLPVLTGQYWFITAYVGMYVLSPFINILIKALTRKQHLWLIFTGIFLFSIWPSVFWNKGLSYELQSGYSVIWFVFLYIMAAYVSRYYKPDYKIRVHARRYILTASLVAILTLSLSYTYYKTGINIIESFRGSLFRYNSTTTLFASLALFILFLNIRITNVRINNLIKFFAPLTLGVYLIHEHPMLRGWFWRLWRGSRKTSFGRAMGDSGLDIFGWGICTLFKHGYECDRCARLVISHFSCRYVQRYCKYQWRSLQLEYCQCHHNAGHV